MYKEQSLALEKLKQHTCINSFENSMKSDINSIENSADMYELSLNLSQDK